MFSYDKPGLWIFYTEKLNLLFLTVACTLMMHWYLHQYNILSPCYPVF